MIVFCAFDQQFELIKEAKKYGLNNYINLVFRKNFSAQVLKSNMRIVGNCEFGILLYRNKLPKFRNNGKMVYNCIEWEKDKSDIEKIHPNQKPISVLKKLIEIFTDEGDVIIDPVSGSGASLVAGIQMNRKVFGFEIKKDFYKKANEWIEREKEIQKKGYSFIGIGKSLFN
jgi:site-specific DNA-methyltransferase (adenine-specific)